MITNYQDYENQLWNIEKQFATSKAILLPRPPAEEIIPIDLDTRTVKIPKKFVIVSQDHAAETLYFTFDRYYDNMDLANTTCIIQFKNAKNEEYFYPVPYFDLTTNELKGKIIMPWVIQNAATKYAGTVKFAFKFFKMDATGKLLYELNTLVAEAIVEQGQNWDLDEMTQEELVLDKAFIEAIHKVQQAHQDGTFVLEWLDNF